jgi:hypothetical protein
MLTIIAPPALKAFLTARAKGASQELLGKLAAEAMVEQESEIAKAQRRRLVVNEMMDTAIRHNNEHPDDLAG